MCGVSKSQSEIRRLAIQAPELLIKKLHAERDALKAEVSRAIEQMKFAVGANEILVAQLARYKAALAEDQAAYLANFLSDPDDIYTSNEEMASAILADRRRAAEGGD